jgi:serine/threonine-protein kinase
MPLGESQMFAGYTILHRLGSGAMGEVYLAQHPRLPRRDALKVLPRDWSRDADYRSRFKREADLASTLWHPHIVGVHDRGEFDDQLWISMDYVDGADAAQLLAEKYPGGMPANEVSTIVTAVASALDYAHKRGLLHRDVKPANIMLAHDDDGDLRTLLADFGIARDINDISGLTATNMTVGTVAYAAPEQLMGEGIDGRADQYALAATAYHLLTGSHLFPYSNPAVVISRHLNAAVPKVGDTHPQLADLDSVLLTALAKDPADRFERCTDFAIAFAERTAGSAASQPSAPTTPAPVRRSVTSRRDSGPSRHSEPSANRRRYGRIAGLAAGAIASVLVVGSVLAWHPWNSAQHGSEASKTSTAASSAVPPAPQTSPLAAPGPIQTNAASAIPPAQDQPVDPASTGPAEGSSCDHAQMNVTTIANSGSIVRCVSGSGGYSWQPDTGEQIDPIIVGQQGWANCLKSSPEAQCVRAAVAVAGGIYPAGPVYPPGAYAVPATLPYGTYGAIIDYGTGQFSMGIAANPCIFSTYDAAGNIIGSGTFNSNLQASPSVVIGRNAALFRTSGCTPWALTQMDIPPAPTATSGSPCLAHPVTDPRCLNGSY